MIFVIYQPIPKVISSDGQVTNPMILFCLPAKISPVDLVYYDTLCNNKIGIISLMVSGKFSNFPSYKINQLRTLTQLYYV